MLQVPNRLTPKSSEKKLSPRNISYQKYLGGRTQDAPQVSKPSSGQKQITLKSPTKPKRSNKRSVRSPRKKVNPKKSLLEVESQIESLKRTMEHKATAKGSVTAKGPVTAKGSVTAKGPVTAKGSVTAKGPVTAKGSVTAKGPVTAKGSVTAKPHTRRSNRRSNRALPKDKGRHISIKKKPVSPDELRRIEQKIKSVRTKKIKDIKSALHQDGIQVSGKSDRLLKDIYFYSKVCNIQITHEA